MIFTERAVVHAARNQASTQYDAVCPWGIPDHSLLQRLSGISQPVFVANGDSDRCKSGCAHVYQTGLAA